MLVLESCIGICMSVQACISICETQSTLYWYNIGLINEYVEQHQHVGVCIYAKKNDDSVKEAPAYCRSFLDSLYNCKRVAGGGEVGDSIFQ